MGGVFAFRASARFFFWGVNFVGLPHRNGEFPLCNRRTGTHTSEHSEPRARALSELASHWCQTRNRALRTASSSEGARRQLRNSPRLPRPRAGGPGWGTARQAARMNEINLKPAHAVPNWKAPASTGKKQPAVEESQVEGASAGRSGGGARGNSFLPGASRLPGLCRCEEAHARGRLGPASWFCFKKWSVGTAPPAAAPCIAQPRSRLWRTARLTTLPKDSRSPCVGAAPDSGAAVVHW